MSESIADLQLPIADWRWVAALFKNWQSAIGNWKSKG